jgi:hypothetical protein
MVLIDATRAEITIGIGSQRSFAALIRACSHYLRDSMVKDHVQFLEARKDATKAFQASKCSTRLRLL